MESNVYKFTCIQCDFHTNLKSNFERHEKTNKHKKNKKCYPFLENSPKMLSENGKMLSKCYPFFEKKNKMLSENEKKNKKKNTMLSENEKKNNESDETDELENKIEKHICKYCQKEFKHRSGMSKHIKYVCKKNEDEDLKELIRLLNEQNQKKDEQIIELMKYNTDIQESTTVIKKQNENMKKQIEKLSKKLKVQNIGTQYSNNGIVNYNVKLLNYVDTDYSHLTKNDYAKCVSDCNHCVKTLIEKVHFNTKKPENMNVYIASMKDKYIMVYKDDKWTLQNRKKVIDRMYSDNECEIDMWLEDHSEQFPELVKQYERYQKNKKEDNVEENVKELIMLDMYNRRNMIKENLASIEGDIDRTIV